MKKVLIIMVVLLFAAAGLLYAQQTPKFGSSNSATGKKTSKAEIAEMKKNQGEAYMNPIQQQQDKTVMPQKREKKN
ncbi:MAG: hypothetical protein WC539_07215 [Nitrospirota bacterium]